MNAFWSKILAVAFVSCAYLGDVNAVNIECSVSSAEPNACYILTPVYLTLGDSLNIVGAGNLTNITKFELKAFTNINRIPSTVFSLFPQLQELILANYAQVNTLSSADFLNAKNLKVLNLKSNQLTSVPYAAFALATELESIDLSYNLISNIEDLAFNGLSKVQSLDLSYNRLSNLSHFALAGLTNLVELNLSHNKIKLVEDGALYFPTLRYLNFNTNELKLLPENAFGVAPLEQSALEVVDFGDNKLSHIGQSVYHLSQLRVLNLTNNKKIDDISLYGFATLPNLEVLVLTNTGFKTPLIGTITPPSPDAVPVPTPTASPLKKLFLAKNKIVDPFMIRELSVFPQLEELSLEENQLIYLEDVDKISTLLPNLKTIWIGENKLNCAWLSNAIPYFESQGINVYTIKKIKTWFGGTIYQKKIIDAEDCFDLDKIFTNVLKYITTWSKVL